MTGNIGKKWGSSQRRRVAATGLMRQPFNNMNQRVETIIFFTVFLAACVSTAPLDNASFLDITNIGQLEGLYRNFGDGGPGAAESVYLSRILWPEDDSLDHAFIETIRVKKQDDKALLVEGLSERGTVKMSTFTEGEDFIIENGVIVLSSQAGIAGFRSGEPLLGFYTGGSKIGLDEKGDGKFHSGGTAAGLAYLFLPLAVSQSQDVRFYRIE